METKVQISKHQTPNTQKGITLVALVITIIVLIILAGVAINAAIDSDGLFSKASEAVEKWNVAVAEEERITQNILKQMNEINGGTTGDNTGEDEETEDQTIAVESISLNNKNITIEKGETQTLIATIMPSNATEQEVSWSTSDDEIVTVDNNGMIEAIKAGTATITATCGEFSDTCNVTVEETVTITIISNNSLAVSLGKFREEENNVYIDKVDSIELKVKKGEKVVFPCIYNGMWNSSALYATSEEYDETRVPAGAPARTQMPCYVIGCGIQPVRCYNASLGYIDMDNYYATEDITFTLYDSD